MEDAARREARIEFGLRERRHGGRERMAMGVTRGATLESSSKTGPPRERKRAKLQQTFGQRRGTRAPGPRPSRWLSVDRPALCRELPHPRGQGQWNMHGPLVGSRHPGGMLLNQNEWLNHHSSSATAPPETPICGMTQIDLPSVGAARLPQSQSRKLASPDFARGRARSLLRNVSSSGSARSRVWPRRPGNVKPARPEREQR